MKKTSALSATLLVIASSAASAQSFNLDIGRDDVLFLVADSSYGAGASQPGHWNAVIPQLFTMTLDDLSGAATSVQVTSDTSNDIGMFPFSLTGEDSKLLEDAQWVPTNFPPTTIVESDWDFTGLANGSYEVYTYAWSADPSVLSDVTIGADTQTVGGSWPGAQTLGITYAKHDVDVTDGTLTITVAGQSMGSARVNGIQLVFGDGPPVLGTNYCSPNPNSTGVPAIISAAGSDVVADNNLSLACVDMPLNKFGYFLASELQGFVANPGGSQGNLCLGQPLGRFASQIQNSGGSGSIGITVDVNNVPLLGPILAGETWNFQCWYRDVASNSNFSDGISIPFQ